MAKQEERVLFKAGDRVTDLVGSMKGIITAIGRLGETAQVQWEHCPQQMVFLSDLKKADVAEQ
jgi:hypothetical protein